MGRRGPPPKPTALNELQGNPGKRAKNDREPKPTAGRPTMPSWLPKEAKAEWKRLVPELEKVGLLTVVDRTALAAYCLAHHELVDATRTLEAEGRIVSEAIVGRKKKDGVQVDEVVGHKKKQHPAVKLQRDAFTRVKQFLAEFGLTPASRARLKTDGGEEEAVDPFQELIRRGQATRN